MIFPRFQTPLARIFFAGVYISIAAAAILLSRDILEVRKQKVFYQVDLEWYGEPFWRGRKSVDIASPSDKLPVQLPGPADQWAGGEGKQITIKAPFSRKTTFTIRFLESHEVSPPTIEVWAGDAQVAQFQVEKGTGYPRIHWPREGKTSKVSFTVDKKHLKPGTILKFKTVSGSWAALQTISASGTPERWKVTCAIACWMVLALSLIAWIAAAVCRSGAGPREIGFTVLLLLFGLSGGLAAGEVLVRALNVLPKPMKTQPVRYFRLSENPVMLYEYMPNIKTGEKDEAGVTNDISTNSAGFRDKERTVQKREGTYRIIFLGDSTTAGSGVGDESAMFTTLLENDLNSRLAPRNYEALNMGVHGYQTLQEIETLRVKGLNYAPDLVITIFCHNDFQLNVDGGVYYTLLTSNLDFKFQNRTPGLFDLVIARSRLAFVVYHRLMGAIKPPTNFDEIVGDYTEKYLQGKTTVEAAMKIYSQLARERGFIAVMAILPVFDQPFDHYRHDYQHEKVKQIVDGFDNIELWDLKEDFARIDNNAANLTIDGLHMSKAGHRVMAEILFERIRKLAGNTKGQ